MIRNAYLATWVFIAVIRLSFWLMIEQRHHARHNDAEGT